MPIVDAWRTQVLLSAPNPSDRQAHPGSTLDVVLVVVGALVVLTIMAVGYVRSRRK